MYANQGVIGLVQKITCSKKYKGIYKKTVERLTRGFLEKHGTKQAEKVRNLLHQIWGAYCRGRSNFERLLEKFKKILEREGT